MGAVSNTGPLIALAKADELRLMSQILGEVLVPPAVERELRAKGGEESVRLNAAFERFLRVSTPPTLTPVVRGAIAGLGPGEQEAIALAHGSGSILVIDESDGRGAARQLGLRLTGVVGILLLAKERGLIAAVRPVLSTMRDRGYWLSDGLLDLAARRAGEG